jgi:hypothetical protein
MIPRSRRLVLKVRSVFDRNVGLEQKPLVRIQTQPRMRVQKQQQSTSHSMRSMSTLSSSSLQKNGKGNPAFALLETK